MGIPYVGIMRILVRIIVIGFLFAVFAPSSSFAKTVFPFQPGEKLIFQLKWLFIPAGEATLEVLPMETIDGRPSYHFRLTARSNGFVDRFYKVRDRIDAITDATMAHTLDYKKSQQEGRTRREVTVDFNWKQQTARYTNFGNTLPPISVLPGTFDPLSAVYHVRCLDMKAGLEILRPISDGKKCVMGRVTVSGRERIRVGGRNFDTFLLLPELKHVGGVFEKSENARIKIWITADAYRIPVRVKSRVKIGSFTGELVFAEGIGGRYP